MWTIRKAHAEDAAALSVLAERSFRDAFGEFNAPADMDLHCRFSYAPSIQADEIADPSRITLVVEPATTQPSQAASIAGQAPPLAAYAQLHLGLAPAAVDSAAAMQIQRFYVARRWHGSGLARRLMQAIAQQSGNHTTDRIWLGVWERNPRAIRFYRNCGFVSVGEQTFLLGTDPQRDVVMSVTMFDLVAALEKINAKKGELP